MKTLKFFSILITIILLIPGCEKEEEENPETDFVEYEVPKGEIGSGGGSITVSDPESPINGAKVEIPENSIGEVHTISMNQSSTKTDVLSDTSIAIDLLPVGLEFQKPIVVSIPYPEGVNFGEQLSVWYFSRQDSIYRQYEIKSVNDDDRIIKFETNHFSTYFLSSGELDFMVTLGKWKNRIAATVYFNSSFAANPVTKNFFNQYLRDPLGKERVTFFYWKIHLRERKLGLGLLDSVIATEEYYCQFSSYYSSGYDLHYREGGEDWSAAETIKWFEESELSYCYNIIKGKALIIVFDEIDIPSGNDEYYVTITWWVQSYNSYHAPDYSLGKFETSNERKNAVRINNLIEFTKDQNYDRIDDFYEPLEARFIAEPSSGPAPLSVHFTDQTSGPALFWDWDFGDGKTSTEKSPDHIFTSPGKYNVRLKVNGRTTAQRIIDVKPQGSAPEAGFRVDNQFPDVNETVHFYDESTNNPTSWDWYYRTNEGGSWILFNNEKDPQFIFQSVGIYDIRLVVENIYDTDQEIKYGYITVHEVTPPVAEFRVDNRSPDVNETVHFYDESTNNPTSLDWYYMTNVMDNWKLFSHDVNPTITFSAEVTCDIRLVAKNIHGEDEEIKYEYIIVEEITTGEVVDIDENRYQTRKIGNQWWMIENLKTTQYASGTDIPEARTPAEWEALAPNSRMYSWYDNNISNKDNYGALYSWEAAMNGANSSNANPSGVQGVCPAGWHLPSDSEWKELEMIVGLTQAEADEMGWRGTNEGEKLKAESSLWIEGNDATNESGFSAIPGGFIDADGSSDRLGDQARIWTSTGSSNDNIWHRILAYNYSTVFRHDANFVGFGYSIRCVKD